MLGGSAAFAAVVVLFAEPLARGLLGPQWLPAVPALRILAVAMCFRSVVVLGSELFYALGRPAVTFRMNVVRVAVFALTLYPLTRWLGIEGAALSVLLAGAAATGFYLLHAARELRLAR